MKSNPQILEQLNIILKNELTAINQYFLHARMLKDKGYLRLASKIYDESIGEMKHADLVIDRLLMLEGHPNVQDLHKMTIGETVSEMLKADLLLEERNQKELKTAISICEQHHDYQSRAIFGQILGDTEEHIDFIETQLGLISELTETRYCQQQMFGSAGDFDAQDG